MKEQGIIIIPAVKDSLKSLPYKGSASSPGAKKLASGLMAFGWFIYDVNYNGLPTIDWI